MSQYVFFEWTEQTITNPFLLFPSNKQTTGQDNYLMPYDFYVTNFNSQSSHFFSPLTVIVPQQYTVGCNQGIIILQTNETFLQILQGDGPQGIINKNYYLTPLIWISTINNCKRYLLVVEEFIFLNGGANFFTTDPNSQSIHYSCNDTPSSTTLLQTSALFIYSTPFVESACFKNLCWKLEKIVWGTTLNSSQYATALQNSQFVALNAPIVQSYFQKNECVVGKNIPVLAKTKIIV